MCESAGGEVASGGGMGTHNESELVYKESLDMLSGHALDRGHIWHDPFGWISTSPP